VISVEHKLFRPEPKMAPSAYKTYAVRVPPASHTRAVTCEAVECEAWRSGWKTALDISMPAHYEAARWIENHSRRAFTWEKGGSIITFTFAAGQQCFTAHREQVRPGVYTVRDGDFRGNPTGRRNVLSERAWVDDFGEHQQGLADQQKRG
jgi:hypothetical protein